MLDDDLDNLNEWIRRLRVEYDIFFNGHRKKPPEDLKARVEKLVKKLAEVNMSFSQRFRYNTLVGRYYVYRDHWRRVLADREQGLDLRNAAPAANDGPAATREPNSGREIQVSISDPASDGDKIRQLYTWLNTMRGQRREALPQISYQQFEKYVSAQTTGIKQRFGCSSVVFRVFLDEDAIKFTARGDSR
jgi:hypothetical protein